MASDNHLGVDLYTAFTAAEVEERIREYLGNGAPEDLSAITKLVRGVFRLKDSNEREDFLAALRAFFCTTCGSGYLPCYCRRDD